MSKVDENAVEKAIPNGYHGEELNQKVVTLSRMTKVLDTADYEYGHLVACNVTWNQATSGNFGINTEAGSALTKEHHR